MGGGGGPRSIECTFDEAIHTVRCICSAMFILIAFSFHKEQKGHIDSNLDNENSSVPHPQKSTGNLIFSFELCSNFNNVSSTNSYRPKRYDLAKYPDLPKISPLVHVFRSRTFNYLV